MERNDVQARYVDRGPRLCRNLGPLWIGLGGGALLTLAGILFALR